MQEYTREPREASGRKARERCSRVAQADWDPKARTFNLIDLLNHSEKGRVPTLLPEKHRRMLASPFAYYRGSAPVMAADLALLPNSGLIAQLCGDAHVNNLGSFTGLDGHVIFDLNDFDETIPGPWEWDVKRMAASLILAGCDSNGDDACKSAVLSFVRSYRETMHTLADMPVVELARYQVLRHPERTPVAPVLRRAELSTNKQALIKLAERHDDGFVFKQSRVAPAIAAKVKQAIHDYSLSLLPERRHFFEQYRIEDVGFRVVGCGSVGMRDYVALMMGAGNDDPLFLQVKEETRSCYAPYLPEARVPENQGQRTAEGQRAMQLQSDLFLGWTSFDGRDYLVRQLRDHKASITSAELAGRGLGQYATICGELLAKGHARSGDPCALFGYMGSSPKFDKAIAKFAVAYADQIHRDFEVYKREFGSLLKKSRPSDGGSKPKSAKSLKKKKKASATSAK